MTVPGAEPRPSLHVTPPSGWLNDPVGGLVHGGRQHLFYQYVPSSTRWQVACHWGHLVGDDLVRWRHLPVALAPGDGDDGVWSGSAVVDRSGPVIVYTSVVDGRLELGRRSWGGRGMDERRTLDRAARSGLARPIGGGDGRRPARRVAGRAGAGALVTKAAESCPAGWDATLPAGRGPVAWAARRGPRVGVRLRGRIGRVGCLRERVS